MKKAPYKDGASGTEYFQALNKHRHSKPRSDLQPTLKPWLKTVIVTMGRKRLLPASLTQWLINNLGLLNE